MAGVFLRDCDHNLGDWVMVEAVERGWEVYDRRLNLLIVIDPNGYSFVIEKGFNKLPRYRRRDLYYKAKEFLLGGKR